MITVTYATTMITSTSETLNLSQLGLKRLPLDMTGSTICHLLQC